MDKTLSENQLYPDLGVEEFLYQVFSAGFDRISTTPGGSDEEFVKFHEKTVKKLRKTHHMAVPRLLRTHAGRRLSRHPERVLAGVGAFRPAGPYL